MSGMPKPYISVDDDPRPVPSSKRPFSERLVEHGAALGSADGVVDLGPVMLKMADAMWMRLVRAATNAKKTSGDDMWEY